MDEETGAAIVEDYESAQLQALKTGLLAAAAIALAGLMFTARLFRTVDRPGSRQWRPSAPPARRPWARRARLGVTAVSGVSSERSTGGLAVGSSDSCCWVSAWPCSWAAWPSSS